MDHRHLISICFVWQLILRWSWLLLSSLSQYVPVGGCRINCLVNFAITFPCGVHATSSITFAWLSFDNLLQQILCQRQTAVLFILHGFVQLLLFETDIQIEQKRCGKHMKLIKLQGFQVASILFQWEKHKCCTIYEESCLLKHTYSLFSLYLYKGLNKMQPVPSCTFAVCFSICRVTLPEAWNELSALIARTISSGRFSNDPNLIQKNVLWGRTCYCNHIDVSLNVVTM